MSTSQPIIPCDSPLHRQHTSGHSRFLVSVTIILAAHAVVLAGLLIQGCQRQAADPNAAGQSAITQEPSLAQPPAAAKPAEEPAYIAKSQTAPPVSTGTPPMPSPPPMSTEQVPSPPPSAIPAPVEVPAFERPVKGSTAAVASVYVVKAGDNLTKVARAHGTTLRALRAINGLKTDRIVAGQKLKIPAGDGTGEGGGVYTPSSSQTPPSQPAPAR